MSNSNIGYRYPALKGVTTLRLIDNNNRIPIQKVSESQNENLPAHGTYGELLFDERWRKKRQIILFRDRNRCVLCTNKDNLQVHHRQYHFLSQLQQFKPPWDYEDHLLITLCKSCHNRGHNKFKVPTLSIK